MSEKHLYGPAPIRFVDESHDAEESDYYERRGDRQDHESGALVAIVASVVAVGVALVARLWAVVRR
jgi:hypothetical protein